MTDARLVVVSPTDLADGFRLAGVATVVSDDASQAGEAIRQLLADGERGVIAVYSPLFEGLDPDLQRRLHASVAPVIVELPTGSGAEEDDARRLRLAERLRNAIGYHVTFSEDDQ